MDKLSKISALLVLMILSSCEKKEEVKPSYCWDCQSYVTTIDTLHHYSFQDHFETDTICGMSENDILHITDSIIYKDSFVLSPGVYYSCFRIYVTHCQKIDSIKK